MIRCHQIRQHTELAQFHDAFQRFSAMSDNIHGVHARNQSLRVSAFTILDVYLWKSRTEIPLFLVLLPITSAMAIFTIRLLIRLIIHVLVWYRWFTVSI